MGIKAYPYLSDGYISYPTDTSFVFNESLWHPSPPASEGRRDAQLLDFGAAGFWLLTSDFTDY